MTVRHKSRRKRRLAKTLGAVSLSLATVPVANAEPLLNYGRNTYGMPGLIDMPTAEVRPDGEFAVSLTYLSGNTQRNQITFQISPRLTGAFRYSRIPNLQYVAPNEPWKALYDRSFDIQWTFWDESKYMPSMAIGLRDFVGTGIFSGEYVVATKNVTDHLRLTAGLGWGRLGSYHGSGGWGDRPDYDFSSTGGDLNSTQWFKGPVAPFVGMSYRLNDQWTLKAEYSSDAYKREARLDDFNHKTAFNFGANYRPNDYLDLELFYMYGTKIGFQISLNLDPKKPTYPSGVETAPLPVKPRPALAADPQGWSGAWTSDPTAQPAIQTAMSDALRKEGIVLESMSLTATTADLRIRNTRYGAMPEAVGRTARIATRALPPSVENIIVTPVIRGVGVSSITMRRTDLEQMADTNSYDMLDKSVVSNAVHDPAQVLTPEAYSRYSWSFGPYTSISLFDPDQPLRFDLGVEASGRYEPAPGWVFSGTLRQKIAGDVGNGRVEDENSDVPVVRTDSARYSAYSGTTINRLQGAWYAKATDTVYTRISAGLLERMYGGVSGEVLWKPADSRIAFGVEANWVKKRTYEQRFEFMDYSTVTTHATAYYDFTGGYVGELSVGRYLARDWGATVALTREFNNGWKVGAFATKTNMSSDEFGEGSFDKGIFFSIPLAWATGQPSLSTINARIRPLTRDGGQSVNIEGGLYDTISAGQGNQIYGDWGRFWR